MELGRVGDQTLHPGELVVELGTGTRVPVRRVKRGDEDAVDGRLQVAALLVGRVSGQFRAGDDGAVRARIATPFQLLSPRHAASYPTSRRAFAGNSESAALSS